MPVMSGWEFREHQRRDPALAPIPVVVVSGAEASGLGAAGHLRKPFQAEELVAAVRVHC
jgi:CheY-like chemotaxis protein